ncbi:MAG: hypothetical protein WC864_02840 [Ilumatobacteraceae bacterium]
MRASNLIVVALGAIGIIFGLMVSWKWRNDPLRYTHTVEVERKGFARLRQPTRVVCAAIAAGAISGVLVIGLVGRLVMRILAATSGNAQGLLTEADETVGEITSSGTIGFIIFVGLGGGIVIAMGYLFTRSWLPAKAGAAGLVIGVLSIGTLGVADALSPENTDFAILSPLWLAMILLFATGLLFATTFTALAARLDKFAQTPGRGRALLYTVLITGAVPPIGAAIVIQIALRTFASEKFFASVRGARSRTVGHIVVAAGTAVTAFLAGQAALEILTA